MYSIKFFSKDSYTIKTHCKNSLFRGSDSWQNVCKSIIFKHYLWLSSILYYQNTPVLWWKWNKKHVFGLLFDQTPVSIINQVSILTWLYFIKSKQHYLFHWNSTNYVNVYTICSSYTPLYAGKSCGVQGYTLFLLKAFEVATC